jgi:hypothetical protein
MVVVGRLEKISEPPKSLAQRWEVAQPDAVVYIEDQAGESADVIVGPTLPIWNVPRRPG